MPGPDKERDGDIAHRRLYITPARPRPGFWRWSELVSGTRISSEGLDPRRRRLLFRAWHRGIREMDLVLGGFADAQLAALSDIELDELEQWLDIPDQQLFSWVNGADPPPAELDTALFRKLLDFHSKGPAST
jgi:antitoxin CptB